MTLENSAFALDSGPFVQLPGPPPLAVVVQQPDADVETREERVPSMGDSHDAKKGDVHMVQV